MSLMRGPNRQGDYEFSLDGEHWTTDRHQVEIGRALERGNQIVSDVLHCARCKQDHAKLIFKKFAIPILDNDGEWGFWSLCPVSGDPILLKSEPVLNE